MISVICVYNNKTVLEDFLLRSLRDQTCDHELVLLDNTRQQFSSAAKALNHGANDAKGKYLMFVHQDIALDSNSWLVDVEKLLDSLTDLGIAGVAGARSSTTTGKLEVSTNIVHGTPARRASPKVLHKPERVQTVDECLFIVPKSVYDLLPFDEEVCCDWHLYAVDYSLMVAHSGLGAYAIPAVVYHRSGGTNKGLLQSVLSMGPYDPGYYQTLDKLLKKHRSYVMKICTTTGSWDTSLPLPLQRLCVLTTGILRGALRRVKRLGR